MEKTQLQNSHATAPLTRKQKMQKSQNHTEILILFNSQYFCTVLKLINIVHKMHIYMPKNLKFDIHVWLESVLFLFYGGGKY